MITLDWLTGYWNVLFFFHCTFIVNLLVTFSRGLVLLRQGALYERLRGDKGLYKCLYYYQYHYIIVRDSESRSNGVDFALDQGYAVLADVLDLSAAFDTVDHTILSRLESRIGIRGMALLWVWSYLSSRTQRVDTGTQGVGVWAWRHRPTTGISARTTLLPRLCPPPWGQHIL